LLIRSDSIWSISSSGLHSGSKKRRSGDLLLHDVVVAVLEVVVVEVVVVVLAMAEVEVVVTLAMVEVVEGIAGDDGVQSTEYWNSWRWSHFLGQV
jgi:hypothetical protein